MGRRLLKLLDVKVLQHRNAEGGELVVSLGKAYVL